VYLFARAEGAVELGVVRNNVEVKERKVEGHKQAHKGSKAHPVKACCLVPGWEHDHELRSGYHFVLRKHLHKEEVVDVALAKSVCCFANADRDGTQEHGEYLPLDDTHSTPPEHGLDGCNGQKQAL